MRQANGTVIFLWPLAKHILTQGMYSSSGIWHGAIDMRCTWDGTTRQPVYAAEDGTVNWVQAWDGKSTAGNQSYGNAVKIRHADYNGQSLETRYAHLSSYLVKNGQTVTEGQLIGYTGNTGRSSGAHLHFEVILAGTRRNPLVWMDGDFSTAWDTVYTYGPGEGPAERDKEETGMSMEHLKSDTFKVGPAGTTDRAAVKEVADRLQINSFTEGDYLVVGPMSGDDRVEIYEKAQSLSLGCVDYVAPEDPAAQVDLAPVLARMDSQDKVLEEISSGLSLILDKLVAAGKALG